MYIYAVGTERYMYKQVCTCYILNYRTYQGFPASIHYTFMASQVYDHTLHSI